MGHPPKGASKYITVILPECGSISIGARVSDCGGTRSAESGSKKRLFSRPYYQDNRSDLPEQHRAIGWVDERLYTLIFEVREDEEGEFYHLVTLWKATREERTLYEEHS
jgi:uncharacterized DUF497 family protein